MTLFDLTDNLDSLYVNIIIILTCGRVCWSDTLMENTMLRNSRKRTAMQTMTTKENTILRRRTDSLVIVFGK